jgi:DNA-binding CsgD family transcriptional regulator
VFLQPGVAVGSVVSDAAVLALVEHVYAAGCDPHHWQRLVEEVHALLPGIAFTTHLDAPATGPIGYSAGIAPEHIQSYLAHYHACNPYSALLAGLQEGKVYCSAMLGTRAWIERHPFYHEWLKPAGNFTYGTSVVLARDRRRLMRVSFDIPDRLGHMEAQCARLLERLSPHMTRAFEVNERLGGAAATEAALAGLLDRLDGAALIVGAQARVAALNGEAEALARAATLLRIDAAGRMSFQEPQADTAFRQALAVALGCVADSAPLAFKTSGDNGEVSVVVLPLRPACGGAAVPAARPRALLVVRRANADVAVPGDLLKSLYGLTAAEAEVAMQIAAGVGVADAADSLGVARATVRNQLCAAMAKVGVHRQGELVAAVAALSPRLRLDRDV